MVTERKIVSGLVVAQVLAGAVPVRHPNVAKRMFRKAIGIDLKAEYHEMSGGELRELTMDFT
jgi:hypothetical protein